LTLFFHTLHYRQWLLTSDSGIDSDTQLRNGFNLATCTQATFTARRQQHKLATLNWHSTWQHSTWQLSSWQQLVNGYIKTVIHDELLLCPGISHRFSICSATTGANARFSIVKHAVNMPQRRAMLLKLTATFIWHLKRAPAVWRSREITDYPFNNQVPHIWTQQGRETHQGGYRAFIFTIRT